MIQTRSIVTRFNPEGFLKPGQYLRRIEALFSADEWVWSESRIEAHVFDTREEAEQAAEARPYRLEEGGREMVPWAIVVGSSSTAEEDRPPARGRWTRPTASEVFEQNERRHLA